MLKTSLIVITIFVVAGSGAILHSGTKKQTKAGCSIPIVGGSGIKPAYVGTSGQLVPNGTSGNFDLNSGESFTLSCQGSSLLYPGSTEAPENVRAICVGDQTFSIPEWYPFFFDLPQITCQCASRSIVRKTGDPCAADGSEVSMETRANGKTFSVGTTCFTETTARTEYATYSLLPENIITQTLNPEPAYQMGPVFAGLNPEQLYSETSQSQNLDLILGNGMSSTYLKDGNILDKGQMAGRSNFVTVQQQRSTFTYANAAPVWQSIITGNWMALEGSLRSRVAELEKGATIYSGTHGVLSLKDQTGTPKDIHLNATSSKLPVPQYLYKVILETGTLRSTAFVIINNPHLTQDEAEALTFCTDFCGGSPAFKWVQWDYSNAKSGYSFCCEIGDFKRTVTSLPYFASTGFYT